MISFLRGRIVYKSHNYLVLETGDIGYQVFGSEKFINDLPIASEAEIFIHHHVREEASDLYGFRSWDDLELFELLLTVSGVGPKSALNVLALASTSDIKEAVVRGDADLLTKVAGIGKKTAERIVLDLKNKVWRDSGASNELGNANSGSDEINALMSLGYSLSEARSALNLVDPSITESGQRVKEALKKMMRS